MWVDIDLEVQKIFHEAVQQSEARDLRTPEDWQGLTAIRDVEKERIADATEKYNDEYNARVNIVRKRLIDDAGSFTFEPTPPVGTDKFDGSDITRRAELEVQRDHERVISQISGDATTQVLALQDSARERDRPHGKAREAFNQSSDRRKEPDRRQRGR